VSGVVLNGIDQISDGIAMLLLAMTMVGFPTYHHQEQGGIGVAIA
jgi:hypothetical protein